MSTNGNYGWKPSKVHVFTCPSGQKVQVRRPGPQLALRVNRIPRTFTKSLTDTENAEGTPEEKLAQMSDEEQDAIVTLAREVIVAMVVSPKLVLNPRENEVGPDDTGVDFWPLFTYAMENFYNMKVPVGDGKADSDDSGEVEVKDLESFRGESGVHGNSVDGVHVSSGETESGITNQGLVDSAGA